MEKLFEMTDDQLEKLLDACKPTPAMYLSGGTPAFGTPQENANRAWRMLGDEMGFNWETVRPCEKGDKFFYAEPTASEARQDSDKER